MTSKNQWKIAMPDAKALELKIKARELEEQAEKIAREKLAGEKGEKNQ